LYFRFIGRYIADRTQQMEQVNLTKVMNCVSITMGDHCRRKANHREGPALHGGGASKWNMKEALLSWAEVAGI